MPRECYIPKRFTEADDVIDALAEGGASLGRK